MVVKNDRQHIISNTDRPYVGIRACRDNLRRVVMKVYAFEHCSCIYESGFAVQSLHTTKKGAYLAMRKFLLEQNKEHYETMDVFKRERRRLMKDPDYKYKGSYDKFEFMYMERVAVREYEVEE